MLGAKRVSLRTFATLILKLADGPNMPTRAYVWLLSMTKADCQAACVSVKGLSPSCQTPLYGLISFCRQALSDGTLPSHLSHSELCHYTVEQVFKLKVEAGP